MTTTLPNAPRLPVLKVPPKSKNFIWRMCPGCLPTRVRLQDKGVQCPENCVSCNDERDDLAHVFFHYPFAVQVCATVCFMR